MSRYAELADVKARAGRLRTAWDSSTDPSEEEIEGFLDASAAELDAMIASRGFATPVTDPIATRALLGVNADMGLLLALRATWPGGSGPTQVSDLIADVEKRVTAYQSAMGKGDLPALLYLASLSSAESQGGASDFTSTDGVEYDYWVRLTSVWPRFWSQDPWGIPAGMQPEFRKGQRF